MPSLFAVCDGVFSEDCDGVLKNKRELTGNTQDAGNGAVSKSFGHTRRGRQSRTTITARNIYGKGTMAEPNPGRPKAACLFQP
jgi:hypothetical protein